jgi:anaerobic magnesium-protoporphyrin IX monomethyl ester cyclase
MKVLHIFPRQTGTRPIHVTIPKRYVYFWEISNYLSKHEKVTSIDCIDPTISIFDLSRKIITDKFDVIIILVRIENIYQTLKFSEFIKSVNPKLNIILYGDIVNYIPEFFKKIKSIDAFVIDGDWELSLTSYINFLKNKKNIPNGVYLNGLKKGFTGLSICNRWLFTDTKKAPIDFYNKLNGRKQLSLTISRGCPYNCSFCLSVSTFGKKESRKDVTEVIDYIKDNKNKFDSFKLFSPTFNLNNEWVKKFCHEMIRRKIGVSWCVSSRIDLLDSEDLICLMSRAGCYKISVGIETINKSAKYLNKEFSENLIKDVAKYCNQNHIILKALIMLGVPGQTRDDILELFRLLKNNKIKIRPTSYSPLNELKYNNKISIDEILRYDKFTYYKYGIKGLSKQDYYKLILDPDNFEKILK